MDRRIIVFFAATFGTILVLTALKNHFFPPPPRPTASVAKPAAPAKPAAQPFPEVIALSVLPQLSGYPLALLPPLPDEASLAIVRREVDRLAAAAARQADAERLAKLPDNRVTLANDQLEVVFSEQGAAVKTLLLKRYQTATRDYARPDPENRPLMLLNDDHDGKLASLDARARLERQSFRLLLPDHDLMWRKSSQTPNSVVFETEVPEKNVRVRKTFTLRPQVYHVDLDVELTPLDGGQAELVYELTGPRGVAVEGIHWKQMTFRQISSVGVSPKDVRDVTRYLDDALNLDPKRSGNRPVEPRQFNVPENDLIFQYTGVMNQFFAALVVVRNDEKKIPQRLMDRVVPNYVGDDADVPQFQQRFQGDVACKAVSLPAKLSGQPVTHGYFLFAGPCKTMLLRWEDGLEPGLEEFYTQQHHLRLLTEAPLDNPMSRFSYNIGWSSLVVFCTNQMHRLLEFLYGLFGSYGIAILIMTLIVRALMYPISRRQAKNARDMSEKMAKLKPELKALEERYKNDSQGKAVAHMELMKKHGVNPLSSCTGCLVVLLQMPIFMGLYYALMESTHLRLAGFLWFPNLAAPDMLVQWNEWPVFSSLAGGLNLFLFTLTLGDFFNLLPIIAVGFMFVQQKMMMPPAMDEQQALQMKMMNWMMLMMGYLFYWVASGLCMYFIVSSAWGMLERKLLPKKTDEPAVATGAKGVKGTDKQKPTGNGQPTLREKASELWQKLLKEAAKK